MNVDMKTIVSMIVSCMAALLVVAGCSSSPPQFRADALVMVISSGDPITQRLLDSEVDVVLALAQAITESGEKIEVVNPRNTSMIQISVTSPDLQAAADSCNEIVKNYTLPTNGPIVRQLLENKVVSQYVNGRRLGTIPCDRPTIAPKISRAAHRTWVAGDRLHAAGREQEALQKYREVLALHPDLKNVRSMVDELTQRTDPRTWLEQHPADWGAWMSIFAELMNSNMFTEAEAHLKKLPHGHDPEKYRASLDNKRSFLQHRQKTGEVPSSASTATNQSALSTDLFNGHAKRFNGGR